MALTEERKGQIAIIALKAIVREKGFKISNNSAREFQNKAKRLGIPTDEFIEFIKEVVKPVLDEMIENSLTLKKREKKTRVEHSS